MAKVSLGIACYNEGKNIGRLLDRLAPEPLDEVIVIASGCTDNTVEESLARPWVKTLVQEHREGKSRAINFFLNESSGDFVVLESGDTLPGYRSLAHLLKRLENADIGVVGAHPIPVDDNRTVMGKVAHLLWRSHHLLALKSPKAGEVIAFKRVFNQINPDSSVDEADIEHQVRQKGLRVAYEPRAVIFNKGCSTIRDLVKQRKRIYHGHILLWEQGYTVSTMKARDAGRAVLQATEWTPKGVIALALFCGVELYSRAMAHWEHWQQKGEPTVWDMTTTTKELT